jgi:predicted ATP-binding protein involved in virulence
MFIKEIELKNFKCFEENKFTFEKQFTAIIGDNGSGKTALLDGIAKGLASLVEVLAPNYNDPNYKNLNGDEIRTVSNKMGSKIALEKMQSYGIKITGLENFTQGIDDFYIFESLRKYYYQLKIDVNKSKISDLPFIGYYKTSRHWSNENFKDDNLYPNSSRLESYNDALAISTTFKTLTAWFRRMAFIQFQRQGNVPEIIDVSNAMVKVIENAKNINLDNAEVYFSAAHNELIVNIGDGQELPIRMLSDGYRNTLGMIGDIAYRMAELNPHLTTKSPGIVLIDELDLHLHPKWQRHIVNDLKTIFPNCQFIVTTHSPFIIQSLESGELLKLDETPEIEYDDFTKKGIEDIAEEFQDVEMPQRSVKFQEMLKVAEEYYNLIEQGATNGKLASLRKRLTELEEVYSEEPAFVALLKAERKSKKI